MKDVVGQDGKGDLIVTDYSSSKLVVFQLTMVSGNNVQFSYKLCHHVNHASSQSDGFICVSLMTK